jgi:hypothetical protein
MNSRALLALAAALTVAIAVPSAGKSRTSALEFELVFDGKHAPSLLHEGPFTTTFSSCPPGYAVDTGVDSATETAFIVLPSSRALRTSAPLGIGKPCGNALGRATLVASGAQSGNVVTAGPAVFFSSPLPPQLVRPRATETVATAVSVDARKSGIVSGSTTAGPVADRRRPREGALRSAGVGLLRRLSSRRVRPRPLSERARRR